MRVLGISPLDKDATVSFVEDGRVVFACAEERLTRVKLQDGFPWQALQLGLEKTGWTLDSIDVVAYGFFDADEEARRMHEAYRIDGRAHRAWDTAESLREFWKAVRSAYRVDRTVLVPGLESEASEFMPRKAWYKRLVYRLAASSAWADWQAHRWAFRQWIKEAVADHRLRTRQLHDALRELGLLAKLRRFRHHDCHAANAYYASGYDRALIISLDGYGSGNCGAVFVGEYGRLRLLHEFRFPNSLGQYYEYVTSGLGFRPGRHEGKIVGLAAYGNPEVLGPALRARFVPTEDGEILMRGALNYFFTRLAAQHFAKRDVAAAYQRVLEEVVQRAALYWVQKTGLTQIAVSGGVNANVKLNQRIREVPGVTSVFVYPNMGDGGLATGAALLVFGEAAYHGTPIANVYYGPEYSERQMEEALREAGLSFERCELIEESVAELLVQNRIVGRFNGRMEYGPRALGNRSILYPAQDPDVNQWLNHQLGRTEFMPFAPAALPEFAGELFHNVSGCEKTAEFMTITFDCTQRMVRECPAAVHVDRTARPQLVNPRENPSFYRLLRAYYEKTGIPAIINTSFNMHEEPIVCSPRDAIRAFLQGRVDYLAMGPFLAAHPKLAEISRERQRPAVV
ncbi:MAG: hypothetical protein KatS3mg110_2995 [Pirellulaceae bacterium]|nr:MAG: hypothetical protein KatS3mg110_2995 [Pirellulaceae bacterium]